MKHEYEIIDHSNAHFHIFLVNLLYRTPHIHRDFEVCLVLEGSATLFANSKSYELEKKDIFILNPFCGHEIKADQPVLILSLQVSPALFSAYYPKILNTMFDVVLLKEGDGEFAGIQKGMLDVAGAFFRKREFYELECVIQLNQLFKTLLNRLPNHAVSEIERHAKKEKGKRMERIVAYIDAHYGEKLLLKDIAAQLNLDLHYLSHFFKENFGIPFQSYLLKIRCEHARQLLLTSDLPLLDICIAGGFSDPKYFNKGFKQQYGCSPKEYRKQFKPEAPNIQKNHLLSTQKFLSEAASIKALEQFGA